MQDYALLHPAKLLPTLAKKIYRIPNLWNGISNRKIVAHLKENGKEYLGKEGFWEAIKTVTSNVKTVKKS